MIASEVISIHAPRTGSDSTFCPDVCQLSISIHAPRTGSDSFGTADVTDTEKFQSTLPARGATETT